MTYNVLMGTLNPTHSLTHSLTHVRQHLFHEFLFVYLFFFLILTSLGHYCNIFICCITHSFQLWRWKQGAALNNA